MYMENDKMEMDSNILMYIYIYMESYQVDILYREGAIQLIHTISI